MIKGILIKLLYLIRTKYVKLRRLINISSENRDTRFDLEHMLNLAIIYERSSKSCLKNNKVP
jgi:hypothetical protein